MFPSGVMETLSLFSLIASSKAPSDDPFSRWSNDVDMQLRAHFPFIAAASRSHKLPFFTSRTGGVILTGQSVNKFNRVIRYDPLVASFPRLTTDAVLLAKLAESWGEATKKLGKQAEHAKRVEAFRYGRKPSRNNTRPLTSGLHWTLWVTVCFRPRRECAIALMQVASLAPDVMPMPGESFDEAKKEKRAKAIDAFCKEPDLSKVMSGSLGHKFLPFHICNDVPGLQ